MMRRFFILLTMALGLGAASAAAATSPPQNTALPTISGTARQGEVLTASPGSWSGTDPMSFGYRWRRCDNNGANCSGIIGATNKTYTLSSADVGNTLRVRVTATNSAGSSTTVSAATDVVKATPPASLTLDVSRGLAVYGAPVTLSGSVSNGKAGETVTIMQHTFPFGRAPQTSAAATVTTDASGSFSVTLRPRIHTVYIASVGATKSDPTAVNVRPQLRLGHAAGFHRYLVRALSARSLVHKYVVVQRWSRAMHVWISIRRVYLTRSVFGSSPTIVSAANFRLSISGVTLRVLMPLSQTVPGYVSGSSNGITA